MWSCRKYKSKVAFSDVTAQIDHEGLHFICPICGHRNELLNVGDGEFTELTQPSMNWETMKPFEV